MAAEWVETTLGEVVELKRGYDLPRRARSPGRVPLVSSSGVSDYHSASKVKGPGVVTGRYGTLGRVFYVRDDFWPLNTTLYVRDFKGNDPRFISYFLTALDYLAYSDKAAVPGVNRNHLHQAEIYFPPGLGEQRAIAHILGTLDDKIELNRRMSETLDEMARAIFKSWFVDFDPVANESARADLPADLAACFPFELVEDPALFGRRPNTWHSAPLSQCVEAVRGLSYKGSGLADAGVPLHNLNSIFEGGGYKASGIKYYTGDFKDRHRVAPGDVVVANTEQGHDRLLIGFAAIVPSEFGKAGIFSHHLYRVRPLGMSDFTPEYVAGLLNTTGMHGVVSGYANGTTVNMLPLDALSMPHVVVPPEPLIRAYSDLASAARRRQEAARKESEVLGEIRGTLLPKLISGELRVPDAEKFVESLA